MGANIKRLFGEEFNSLLLLNLITAALTLPVVTLGPALVALYGTLYKVLDDTCDRSRVRQFWTLFKAKFWKGVLLELTVGGYGAMLLWCSALAGKLGDRGLVLWMVTVLMGSWAALSSVCVCQLLAATEQPFGTALWNGICLALGRLPLSLPAALSTYGVLLVCYLLYPISILPLAVILLSAMAALAVSILTPAVQELFGED